MSVKHNSRERTDDSTNIGTMREVGRSVQVADGTLTDATMSDEEFNDQELVSSEDVKGKVDIFLKSVRYGNIQHGNIEGREDINMSLELGSSTKPHDSVDSSLLCHREDQSTKDRGIPGLGDLQDVQESSSSMFWGKFREGQFKASDPPPYSASVPSRKFPESSTMETSHQTEGRGDDCEGPNYDPSFGVQNEPELPSRDRGHRGHGLYKTDEYAPAVLNSWQRGTAGARRSLSGDDYYNEKVGGEVTDAELEGFVAVSELEYKNYNARRVGLTPRPAKPSTNPRIRGEKGQDLDLRGGAIRGQTRGHDIDLRTKGAGERGVVGGGDIDLRPTNTNFTKRQNWPDQINKASGDSDYSVLAKHTVWNRLGN